MVPGLQLLAISSGAAVASHIRDAAQGAAENFAELFARETADSPTGAVASDEQSAAELLAEIHTAVRDHLQRLGLPDDISFQIEVRENGKLSVNADSGFRMELEDAITQDDALVGKLQQHAWKRTGLAQSYQIHWPPLNAAMTAL